MRKLLFALALALLPAIAQAQPATTTAPGALLTTPLVVQPIAQSITAWTTNGARFRNPSVTFTDTSSSGTVAAAYTDVFCGATIASIGTVTYTKYGGCHFVAPATGTNVTFGTSFAAIADSFQVTGAFSATGTITATGLTTGTQVSCLGLSSGNAFVLSTGSCGGVITAGTTPTSGIASGDFISSTSNLAADSGVPVPVAASYWYAYGVGNANCFNVPTCTVPTGQTAPAGFYNGTASNSLAYLWSANRWVNANSIFEMYLSTNQLGITDGNSCIGTGQPPSCGSVTITGQAFSLRFTGSSIVGSPVTISYTGLSGDTLATVATKLCNNIIASSAVTNSTNQMVCDANQGGGGFNLQWSVNTPITVASVGGGTITLQSTPSQLDGVFIYHTRDVGSFTNTAGSLYWCDEWSTHIACDYIIEDVAATGVVGEYRLLVGSQTVGISEGVAIQCGGTGSAPYGGIGTLTISNSGCVNSGSLYFTNASGQVDVRLFENASGSFLLRLGTNNEYVVSTNLNSVIFDFGNTVSNALTIQRNLYLTDLPSTGSSLVRLCINTATGQVSAGSGC